MNEGGDLVKQLVNYYDFAVTQDCFYDGIATCD
jgi:hypothetical protein